MLETGELIGLSEISLIRIATLESPATESSAPMAKLEVTIAEQKQKSDF